MHTRAFCQSLRRIVEELRLEELNALLQGVLEGPNRVLKPDTKNRFSHAVFELDSAFARLEADPATHPILSGLELGRLLSRDSRAELITFFNSATSTAPISANNLFWGLGLALSLILSLNTTVQRLLVEDRESGTPGGAEVVPFEVLDYDGSGVSAARLAIALQELTTLYEAVASLRPEPIAPPVIRWVDSGSNITLGFEGLAELVREIREAFAEAWRVIRFSRNSKLERDIETSLKQLTFLKDLEQAVVSGALTPEAGAIARRQVTTSMLTLLGAGVSPVDLDATTTYDKREVLAAVRDQRLLTPGEPASADGVPDPSPQGDA